MMAGSVVFEKGGLMMEDSKFGAEQARELARLSVARLTRSERGRSVAKGLFVLLDGPIAGLDSEGWAEVLWLCEMYRGAWTGTALAALAEVG
jgi:hypothetical protein